jgi:hypothetical protein
MKTESKAEQSPSTPTAAERRRHQRHRHIQPLYVARKDGAYLDGTTFEISESGLSAAITGKLTVGEEVQLSFIAGERIMAIVRREQGTLHGFEFIGLTPRIQEKLQKLCEGLPQFQTLLDI